MARATKAQLLKQVKLLVVKWQGLLGLNGWSIETAIAEGIPTDVAMFVQWHPHYRSAKIFINPVLDSTDNLERTVVHELAHLFLAPIKDIMDDELNPEGYFYDRFHNASETTVEGITSAIMRVCK